ncbi:MAG: hypothetical protein EPO26_06715 [Chloroflexota bacterium]|nr:MAG: hypothetical protein EPO26_06715 [Chloroflexota bacterium]
MVDRKSFDAGFVAALVYVPLALLSAGLFALAAAASGRAGPTVIVAGAFWVGLLVLIVLMPIVIPFVRARSRR